MSERDEFGIIYREGLCREQAQVLAHEKFLPGRPQNEKMQNGGVLFISGDCEQLL